jgi:hypothetical protein
MSPGSRAGSGAGSTLAADGGELDVVTVCCRVASVVSMVVNHMLSAHVVLSSIVLSLLLCVETSCRRATELRASYV